MSAGSSDTDWGTSSGTRGGRAVPERAVPSAPDTAGLHVAPPAGVRTRLTLKPGDNGTKKLLRKYGSRLLAVRYRSDAAARRRFKTVELLEEELPWDPIAADPRPAGTTVLVRIAFDEAELREQAKTLGARWQKDRKLWQMTLATARSLGLEPRVVK